MRDYLSRLFHRPSQNYKPIDGIRAIAVLWVIFFYSWLFQYLDFKEVSDGIKFNVFAEGRLTDLEIVWTNSIISLVVIILAATLMYLFVEQPFQDLKSRFKTR